MKTNILFHFPVPTTSSVFTLKDMITAMLIVFVLGYLFIALENKIHINKQP